MPHAEVGRRLERYLPGVAWMERRHVDDLAGARMVAAPWRPGETLRVVVLGAVGTNKGSEVLAACVRDAAARRLPLEFRLVGYTDRDKALRGRKHFQMTGRYDEAAVFELLAEQKGHVAFFPGVAPETYSYTLSIAFAGGLYPVAFDIGALAARIREWQWGQLLPVGEKAARVNDRLLAWAQRGVTRSRGPRWRGWNTPT